MEEKLGAARPCWQVPMTVGLGLASTHTHTWGGGAGCQRFKYLYKHAPHRHVHTESGASTPWTAAGTDGSAITTRQTTALLNAARADGSDQLAWPVPGVHLACGHLSMMPAWQSTRPRPRRRYGSLRQAATNGNSTGPTGIGTHRASFKRRFESIGSHVSVLLLHSHRPLA